MISVLFSATAAFILFTMACLILCIVLLVVFLWKGPGAEIKETEKDIFNAPAKHVRQIIVELRLLKEGVIVGGKYWNALDSIELQLYNMLPEYMSPDYDKFWDDKGNLREIK